MKYLFSKKKVRNIFYIIQEFIEVTSSFRISPLKKDNLVCKGDVSGSLTINAYFNLLEGASPHKVPCKMLWN